MKRSLALLGLSGLLPIIVLTSGFALSSLQAERETLSRRADILSSFSATLLGRELAAQSRAIRMVAQSPTFDEGLDEARFKILGERLHQNDPNWYALSIATREGKRVLSIPAQALPEPGDTIVELGSLQRAVQSRQPVVGEIVPGPDGWEAFAVRAPVIRGGEVEYVVSAVLPAEAIKALLSREPPPEGWRVAVVDSAGREATHVGADAGNQFRSFRNAVPGTGWAVMVEVPDRAFVRLNRRAQAVMIGGALIAMLLFAGMGWMLYRHLQSVRESETAAVHAHRLEALGRLTGGVAHDLNNLLTPVIGGLELLRRRLQDDERALRLIHNADVSAERARKLVARLLAFSRSQALSQEAISLPELFEGMRDLLSQSLGLSCSLRVVIAPRTPRVWADRDQLELVIMNLVVNARDAMERGGEVILEARPATRGESAGLHAGRYVAIQVHDKGVGMDEATLRRAQEPFFSTKAVGHGTGLGLSMAHGFAEQSGGGLLLSSRVGEGTVVTIVLPTPDE